MNRLPIIGIMGSGADKANREIAAQAGRLVAAAGLHLLTGGGGGAMEAASQGFASVQNRKGLAIGILPARHLGSPKLHEGYPNPYVELPIHTHLERSTDPEALDSRNPINVLTANGLIFLAGSGGTAAELRLAQNFARPRVLWLDDGNSIGEDSRQALIEAGEHVTGEVAEIQKFLEAIKRA